MLETYKVEVDSKNNSGGTLLLYAAEGGHVAVVQLLLKTGKVKIDSINGSGGTPLSWAAEEGHDVVVKLLQSSIK